MLSVEEISDRLEIDQVLTAYATAVDAGRFAQLTEVFTDDAVIDYSATGGATGGLTEIIDWLGQVLPNFTAYCHHLGNQQIDLAGDTATSRTLCLNPMQAGDASTFLIALYYRDEWRRTEAGWRISRRELELCLNAPFADFP